jgi:hypothetical protein
MPHRPTAVTEGVLHQTSAQRIEDACGGPNATESRAGRYWDRLSDLFVCERGLAVRRGAGECHCVRLSCGSVLMDLGQCDLVVPLSLTAR